MARLAISARRVIGWGCCFTGAWLIGLGFGIFVLYTLIRSLSSKHQGHVKVRYQPCFLHQITRITRKIRAQFA